MKKKIITREYCHTLNVYEETSGVCCVTLDMLIAARGIAPEIFREEVCVGNGDTYSWKRKWVIWKAHWKIDNKMRLETIVELYSPLVSNHYDEIIIGGYASSFSANHCYINLMTNEVKF